MRLAIIPARCGSKGLKDKNIRPLAGKPMLAYTVEAALQSGKYDCVHVSTDSPDYAKIAEQYGAHQPFLRCAQLAGDAAESWDVVRWTLEKYQELGMEFEEVTLLQPTSPLRDAKDIQRAFEIMEKNQADAVVSVCEVDHSPLWCNVLPEDGNMKGFLDEALAAQRQSLPDYYRINGAIYMVKTSLLYEKKMQLYGEKTYAYVMKKEHSVDIDSEIDFWLAQAIIKGQ